MNSNSRVWVFGLLNEIDQNTIIQIYEGLSRFINGWRAHGVAVLGSADLVHGRFIIIAADPSGAEVSGCSIDSMFNSVKMVCSEFGQQLAATGTVFYRDGDNIVAVSREEFVKLWALEKIRLETLVFDTNVQTLAQLRESFELPLSQSWHSRLVAV